MAKQARARSSRIRGHWAEGGLGLHWWVMLLNNYGFTTDVATSQRHLLNTEAKPQKDEYKTGNEQNSLIWMNYPN